MNIFVEFIGWLGAGLILVAYALVSTQRMSSKSTLYYLLNLFGAGGVVINALTHGAFPPTVLNVAWILIAIYGLISTRKK